MTKLLNDNLIEAMKASFKLGNIGFTFYVFYCLFSFAFCTFTAEEKKFQREAVRTHNTLRAIHLAPALKLDINLTKLARKLADEAAIAHGFYNISTGENIYESTSTNFRDISGKEVTEAW